MSGDAPAVPVIRKGKGGNHEGLSIAVKLMSSVAVLRVVLKQRERRQDVSLLNGHLIVQREVPAFAQKSTACGVCINSCNFAPENRITKISQNEKKPKYFQIYQTHDSLDIFHRRYKQLYYR